MDIRGVLANALTKPTKNQIFLNDVQPQENIHNV